MNLFDELKTLDGVLPMHMPGHKRNFVKFPWLRELGGEFDITEIEGFDDLHDPDGLILDINRRAAALWGSRQAFLTVNGSTGGIFAAIAAAVPAGGRVLVARNCHRSVFNAASALRLQTEYVVPPIVSGFGIFGSVTPEAVDRALREKPCHAVVVTSPTYEGVMSDVRGIAEVCAMHGALLVVDGAHGAHLGLSDAFPDGGTGEDADIVVQSLHKTLPALTQTAIVHIASHRIHPEKLAEKLSVFVTSSPSYVLMAGAAKLMEYLEKEGREQLEAFARDLERFRREARQSKALRLLGEEDGKIPEIFKFDQSKLYFDTLNCAYGGYELKSLLRKECGIELEGATSRGVLAYATVGDDAGTLSRLRDGLMRFDKASSAPASHSFSAAFDAGEKVCEIFDADSASRVVPLHKAVGKVSAEAVWIYPPAVPVLLPGERVTGGVVELVSKVAADGGKVMSTAKNAPDSLAVLLRNFP